MTSPDSTKLINDGSWWRGIFPLVVVAAVVLLLLLLVVVLLLSFVVVFSVASREDEVRRVGGIFSINNT